MIQFRWIVPNTTTTETPLLQWRIYVAVDASGSLCPGAAGPWLTVPTSAVPMSEFKAAQDDASE